MAKPQYHVFICTNQRPAGNPRGSCAERGSLEVWQKFADILNQTQMFEKVLVTGVRSCLGPCQAGPIVVVYPDAVWYKMVTVNDVEEIFESHFKNGKPVERLILPDAMFG
ncbi:Ferredoxin, 2Fe-2S [hydrothermal vent metagenome]|uniref:Ferredoxin, 2Fe-2S n=1 Tax=hydrothermal vent metagenome TaxID=652676 RepID=A0A3B1C7X5_9ZZZZ